MEKYSRRKMLQFLGRAGAVSMLVSGGTLLASCKATKNKEKEGAKVVEQITEIVEDLVSTFKGIDPIEIDDVVMAETLDYHVIVKWDDPISEKDSFGYNNDYLAFIPLDPKNPSEGLLWVNHEYMSPMFVSGYTGGETEERTKEQVEKEQYSVGGSIIKVKRGEDGKWKMVKNDPYNRRLNGLTKIPFAWHESIAGSDYAIGTFANCSGGVTPWGTILTAEENYHAFYGETDYTDPEWKRKIEGSSRLGWDEFFDHPPEHYGWVVEVDVVTGTARKLVALGRCAHECATVHVAKDGRLVVYTGDDANDQCLYKFISAVPGSLEIGTLYVANIEKGEWVSLDYVDQPILREKFSGQTEVLIRLRESAALVGGTPLARPEDIDIDPITKDVFVSLTNNVPKGDYYGQILKIVEDNEDKTSLTFKSETFLAGGEETNFACPDNMAFDLKGNLWFTSDISGSKMNQEPYLAFKNNGLYVVPTSGAQAGKVIQVMSAPTDAEFTGPFFSPDGKTLFLSVQHPGERSSSLTELTSHWPDGGDSLPRSSVIAVEGKLIEAFNGVV